MNNTNQTTNTCAQEFSELVDCTFQATIRYVLRLILLSIGIICMLTSIGIIAFRFNTFKNKPTKTKVMMGLIMFVFAWTIFYTSIALSMEVSSYQAWWMQLIVSILASIALDTVVWYVHIQLDLAVEISKWRPLKGIGSYIIEHRGIIQLVYALLVTVVFLMGPLITYLTQYSPGTLFWIGVIVGDLIIPYFCYIGISMSHVIKKSRHSKYRKLGKQLYVTSIVCGIIGMSTFLSAVFSIIYTRLEWFIFDLCWCIANIFYIILLFMFARKQLQRNNKPTSTDTSGTSGTSGNTTMKDLSSVLDKGSKS